jgi:hypothetical protein
LNCSIAVSVKGSKQGANILVGDIKLGLNYALGKLRKVKSAVSIVIHDFEDSTDPND